MASIFSKIVAGEIPCFKVAETENCLAFLDISPKCLGHTLVIPKREEDQFFDLSDDELCELMVFAKKVSQALEAVIPCLRVGVAVVGLEVPHVHVHLQPLNTMNDFGFKHEGPKLDNTQMQQLADQLADSYEKLT